MRRHVIDKRSINLKTRYSADVPLRSRFATLVRSRTLENTDSIGLVVRKLFQLALGNAKYAKACDRRHRERACPPPSG